MRTTLSQTGQRGATRRPWLLLCASLGLICACGGGGASDAGGHDATVDASDAGDTGPALCASDAACDDGLFCNGAERCAPDDPTADILGCASATSPCLDGQTCDEAEARCITECEVAGDADRDGHDSID